MGEYDKIPFIDRSSSALKASQPRRLVFFLIVLHGQEA
jgi:hypothetical protein